VPLFISLPKSEFIMTITSLMLCSTLFSCHSVVNLADVSGEVQPTTLPAAMIIPTEGMALTADPEYQQRFRDMVKSPPTNLRELENLQKFSSRDTIKYIHQAIIYATGDPGKKDPTAHGMAFFSFVKAADLDRSDLDMILAMIPLLQTKDPKVAQLIDSIQGRVESHTERPDFSSYGNLLSAYFTQKSEPPRQLMLYMLHKSPGQGMVTIAREMAPSPSKPELYRKILWAEHLVSDYLWKKENQFLNADGTDQNQALKELKPLCDLPYWWVHLYAAEILNKHPELRTLDLTSRLKKDDDPAVKKLTGKW
jgi:hypothetical protein